MRQCAHPQPHRHGAAAQVLAGAEPEKTNEFLQMLAQAAAAAVRSRGAASPPGRYANQAPAGTGLPQELHLEPLAATLPARRSSPAPVGSRPAAAAPHGHALVRGAWDRLEGGPASVGGPPSEAGAAPRWSPEADSEVHRGLAPPGWSGAESRQPQYARGGAHPAAGGPRMQPAALPPLPAQSASRPGSGLDARVGQTPAGELYMRASHPIATWSGEQQYTEPGRVTHMRRVQAAAGELRPQSSEDGALYDQGSGVGRLRSGAAPGVARAHATGAAGGGEAIEDMDDLAVACALVAAVTKARFPVSLTSCRSSTLLGPAASASTPKDRVPRALARHREVAS